ncbi:MAG: efflux RND transporter permease subunit [Rhizobiales bacterium]|nr:efflux RND transporter permease subunit [Hyphomicrobiales bacterium]
MNLPALALRNRAVTYFAAALLFIGGVVSFLGLGQLEDPDFTIKNALITTTYPGASPAEVEQEITDRIELAIQEMQEIHYLESFSKAGLSIIRIEVKPEYWADRLPQVWDGLRRKIRNIEADLPPGAGRPQVNDDFGDVFGFQLAVVGDGFSYAELESYAKRLKKELSLVEGIARVDLWGAQRKIIYLDVAETQLTELGLSLEHIAATLQLQNAVVDAGGVDLLSRRLRIAPTGAFTSPEDIGDLTIRSNPLERAQALAVDGRSESASELIRVRDIGTVRPGYADPPFQLMRFGGEPAIGLSISNESGVNIVDVGEALEERLAQLRGELPIGIEVHKVHWQSDVVSEAVNGFLINFVEALVIVIVIIALFMGWRTGVVIGFALIFTLLATFILMAVTGIDLQRVSLGALVVALGMMVDNAIVVADGYLLRRQKGMSAEAAAVEAAKVPAWPLLGATVVAVMSFYPIFASTESVGEYCRTLFTVIAISLLVSWVVSVTITPLQCIDLLKADHSSSGADPYAGRFFRTYRRFLEGALAARWLVLTVMIVLMFGAVAGFGQVRQLFFPDSSMAKFMVDYWAPEGTRIQTVSTELRAAEDRLLADERVEAVATFIGSGPPRFYLPVEPELPNPSYGQLIVNVRDARDIDGLLADLDPWLRETYPDALPVVRKYGVGPSNTWKLEARLIGPAEIAPDILRQVAERLVEDIEREPLAAYVRTDWRQRVQKVVSEFNQERGRWAAVTREDLANAMKRAFDGRAIGLYRERDDLIPIVIRRIEEDRQNVAAIDILQIQPAGSTLPVPVGAVVDRVGTSWEDPLIWRRDRRRTITIQSNPILGVTPPELQAAVTQDVGSVPLPPGFTLDWGGDHESSTDANRSLVPGMIPAFAVISLIIVALFNAFRPPLIIILVIPFALIGITAGLLAFDVPFGFMALLGAMSLAGMMIKNGVVLLDQIGIDREAGLDAYEAVVQSAMTRLRPVMLAAGTTVLGVIPLLQDVFWVGMAVTIMGGLAVGSLLTMIMIPVLYAILYRADRPEVSHDQPASRARAT